MTESGEGKTTIKRPHTLQIDRRNRTAVTGVVDVSSFNEEEIVLRIDSGDMTITGHGLHIAKLLLEDGQLHIDGRVDGVLYENGATAGEKGSVLRRLFKA